MNYRYDSRGVPHYDEEADKVADELKSLRAEAAYAKEFRDWAAEANTRNARELLEAMGGDPAYSLLDNAKRLRAENAALQSQLIERNNQLIQANSDVALLRHERECLLATRDDAMWQRAATERELAALQADARRYRWLRDEHEWYECYLTNTMQTKFDWKHETLDAAIDSAMGAKP